MKRLLVLFAALAVSALSALAADVAGKWTGAFTSPDGNAQTALVVLKQDGSVITGTAGPDESQQWPIKKGKIEGNKVSVEVTSEENGMVYTVELVLEGDHLKGDIIASRGDQIVKAKMDLTRSK